MLIECGTDLLISYSRRLLQRLLIAHFEPSITRVYTASNGSIVLVDQFAMLVRELAKPNSGTNSHPRFYGLTLS